MLSKQRLNLSRYPNTLSNKSVDCNHSLLRKSLFEVHLRATIRGSAPFDRYNTGYRAPDTTQALHKTSRYLRVFYTAVG